MAQAEIQNLKPWIGVSLIRGSGVSKSCTSSHYAVNLTL